jgi:hypothetical protein
MEMPQNNPQNDTKEPNTWVKVIVLIALILLLILGILLPIKLVPNAVTGVKSFFSTLFNRDSVTLAVDKNELRSGEPFTLSWNGSTRTNGSYILQYPCMDGVRLETSVNQPFEKITCDAQFYFSPTENQIELTGVTERTRTTEIPVTLSFLSNSDTEAKKIGEYNLTIVNVNLSEETNATSTPVAPVTPVKPTSKPATTTPVKPTPVEPAEKPVKKPSTSSVTPKNVSRPSNPNGKADLAVQILAVGYLNPETNKFVPFNAVTSNMRAAVKFVVINNGDKNTGTWGFRANLPSQTNPTYTAINRANLGPGDGIEYVLGFEGLNNVRENTVTITVDPQNVIAESNENNNSYSAKITNPRTDGSTNPTPAYGKADLAIRVVSATYSNNQATIRFEVQNNGDRESGSYRFRAQLPTYSNNEYVSGYQNSLKAGSKTYFTISFNDLQNYGANYTNIMVDPYNEISESNENNNSTQATVWK